MVDLSLFVDLYLFYCGNDAEQRAQHKALADAAKYAQQRGEVILAVGNAANDLQNPTTDPGGRHLGWSTPSQPRGRRTPDCAFPSGPPRCGPRGRAGSRQRRRYSPSRLAPID